MDEIHINYSLSEKHRHLKFLNDSLDVVWSKEVVFRVIAISVLMFFTLLGNIALFLLIICNRRLRKRRVNIFLANLAIGDVMVCLITMTTEILFVAFGEWILGELACKLTVYGQIVTLASTTFLLTAMSIDRYQVIVCPLRSLKGQPKIWRKVLGAWIMAFVFALPQLFIFVQTDVGIRSDGTVKHMCLSKGYQEGQAWQRKVYFTFLTTYILIIPTVIMSFCYINIVRVVFIRASENPTTPKLKFTSTRRSNESGKYPSESHSESSGHNETSITSDRSSRQWSGRSRLSIPKKAFSSSKKNIVKMTLSVIIAFIVCWSPYFIIGLIRIYSGYEIQFNHAFSISELMAMFHSLLNPIIYGTFSKNAIAKTLKTNCARRNKEKIVIDISLGSDFDSLVFVTNPELYIDPNNKHDSLIRRRRRYGGCRGCIKRIFEFCCNSVKCSGRTFSTLQQNSIEMETKQSYPTRENYTTRRENIITSLSEHQDLLIQHRS